MTSKDRFKHWLESEYKYGKLNRTLKSGSVAAYVSGIKSLSVKLGIKGNGIYDMEDLNELKRLHFRISDLPKATKDEKSHYNAFLKFKGVV